MGVTQLGRQIISWENFAAQHQNCEDAFESLCGSLFRRMYTEEGVILRYNPQNPGIECEPTTEKGTKKQISFQAKYFSSVISYRKIEDSAKKIVKYYSGKIDKVYLFCNRDFKLTGKQYKSIEALLFENGIELVPFTNQAILDAVIDYPRIVAGYFSTFSLSHEWFGEKLNQSSLETVVEHKCKYHKNYGINHVISGN